MAEAKMKTALDYLHEKLEDCKTKEYELNLHQVELNAQILELQNAIMVLTNVKSSQV